MKKFTRHLLRTTALTTALTLSFLLIIDLLIQSAGQLEHLPPRLLILTHLLQLPDRLQQFLPAAVLIGAILGLGQLANQNELTIAQNSGQSPLRIATPALILALFLGALSLLLNQTIAPKWQQKSQQLHNPTAPIAPQTLWFKDQQTLIQINHLNPDGSLGDLRLITHTPSQITLTTAPRATYHPPHWQLQTPTTHTITPKSHSQTPANPQWHTPLTPKTLQLLSTHQPSQTLAQRHTLIQFLKANHLNHQKESLQYWQHLLHPLTTATMLLLALPFVFNHSRHSQQSTRLIIGILLGTSYYILSGILSNLTLLLHLPAPLGALLPLILFALPPLYWLQRH